MTKHSSGTPDPISILEQNRRSEKALLGSLIADPDLIEGVYSQFGLTILSPNPIVSSGNLSLR